MQTRDACPICGATAENWRAEGTQYVVCQVCDLHFRYQVINDDVQQSWELDYYGREDVLAHHMARKSGFEAIERIIANRAGRVGRLLDVGCGVGIFGAVASSNGWQVMAVEPSSQAAAIARRNEGVKVLHGDFMTMADDLGHQDVITTFDVARCIESPLAFLQRIHSLLRPGGLIVIRESNADFPHNARTRREASREQAHVFEYMQEWSVRAMDRALRRAGFSEVEILPSPLFYDGDASLARRLAKPLLGAWWDVLFRFTGQIASANYLGIGRK